MDFIKFGDFVEVVTEKLAVNGLPISSIVFVAGTQSIPENEDDPYTLRTKFIVCPVVDDHLVNNKFIMLDPRNVMKVSNTQQKKLTRIMEQDFAKNEATN